MLLLENKCNTNVINKYGNTPLIFAALANKMDTVRALVEAGCDITIRNGWDKTAAECAETCGYHAIAEYLRSEESWRAEEAKHNASEAKHLPDRPGRPSQLGVSELAEYLRLHSAKLRLDEHTTLISAIQQQEYDGQGILEAQNESDKTLLRELCDNKRGRLRRLRAVLCQLHTWESEPSE